MSKPLSLSNTQKNQTHYDALYGKVKVEGILRKLAHLETFLEDAITTDTSWVAMYRDGFKDQLKGKRVLELGCGDGLNAAVMAALGADVWANDISTKSGAIVSALNQAYKFEHTMTYLEGDFLELPLPEVQFDYVVGKAFAHHLTHEQEDAFLQRIVKVLKPDGMVRYVEPAVNSKWLDSLRWMVPVKGRPSALQPSKFRAWKASDPHPERDNSGKHYKKIGQHYFQEVKIHPIGTLERLHRLFPDASWNRAFRRKAYRWERSLPGFINYLGARTQTIDYKFPKESKTA